MKTAILHRRVMRFVSDRFLQPVLCAIFAKIYRRWLWNDFYETYDKVLYVGSWRSARVASIGKSGKEVTRRWVQPCFWIFR